MFARSRHCVRPTAAGVGFIEDARRILDLWQGGADPAVPEPQVKAFVERIGALAGAVHTS